MAYLEIKDSAYGQFDAGLMREKGLELRDAYAKAHPFPHVVIDDFVTPAALDMCLEDFPRVADPESRSFEREQERLKTSYNPDYLTPRVRAFFYSLNSRPFLTFLENMTGVKGLIPDPYFLGGGFHQTNNGGHLSVHADFNFHKPLRLERRLNLLIYLNKNWPEGAGGALELWDREMKACAKAVAPHFNRAVVFSTDDTSYHGHPSPLAHPEGTPRRSIALYYYTATWDGTARSYTTQFKKRPESQDAVDWRVRRDEIMDDFLPPILVRNIRRLARRLRRAD